MYEPEYYYPLFTEINKSGNSSSNILENISRPFYNLFSNEMLPSNDYIPNEEFLEQRYLRLLDNRYVYFGIKIPHESEWVESMNKKEESILF